MKMRYYFVDNDFNQVQGTPENAKKINEMTRDGKLRVIILQKDDGDAPFSQEESLMTFFTRKYVDTKKSYPLIIVYNVDWAEYKSDKLKAYANKLMSFLAGFGYYAQSAIIGSPEYMGDKGNKNNTKSVKHINEALREGLKKRFLYFFTKKQPQTGPGFKATTSGLQGHGSGADGDGDEYGDGDYTDADFGTDVYGMIE